MTSSASDAPASGAAASPVRAVFFDFGGVFIDSPFAAVGTAAAKLGLGPDDLIDVVFGPYDTDTDHPWHRLERGEITFDEARSGIGDLSESRGMERLDPIVALADLAGGYEVREFMVQAVRDLRAQGITTGVITNNIAEFGSTWRAMIPVDELFDDVVDSSSVGMRKPDPAIYRLACERVGVDPAAAVFIDDYQGNVDGARAVGLQAVWCGYSVASTQAALAELIALVG
ncbi:MAG: HAD family phosphatase [Acidimicrobiales bacterium]